MKKVKVMLTAIGILAAVGGAVALKAKTFGSVSYCTTTNLAATICNLSTPSRTVLSPIAAFKYTIVNAGDECPVKCTTVGSGLAQ